MNIWDELLKVYNMPGIPDEAMSIIGDVMLAWSEGQEGDTISRKAAIDVVHKIIHGFFDLVNDDSEEPISDKDELLLEVNKAICNGIKDLPSAQPAPCEFCKHNNIADDKACLMCSAERSTDG